MRRSVLLALVAFGLTGFSTSADAVVAGQRTIELSYRTAPLDCVEDSGSSCANLGGFFLQPGDRIEAQFVFHEKLFGGALNGQMVSLETGGPNWIVNGAPQPVPPPWLVSFDTDFLYPSEASSAIKITIDENLQVSSWSFNVSGDPFFFTSSDTFGALYSLSPQGAESRLFTSGGVAGSWTTTVIPVPATLPLLLSGLAFCGGLGAMRRRQ